MSDALTLKVYQQSFAIMAKALKTIAQAGSAHGMVAAVALDEIRCLVQRATMDNLAMGAKAGELKEDLAQRKHLRVIK